ncbi:MAG: acyl-CoA dehydrogenase family protein, partial [Dehalococcoidia bacterium]
MEFGFTEDQDKLRKEGHDFFVESFPEDYRPDLVIFPEGREIEAFRREIRKKAVDKGYPTAGWPKKYGGMGFTAIEQAIVSEELSYWGWRWETGYSFSLVGPTTLAVGSEEQKERWIPAIARGEAECHQVFTEPDAGSDEANVQMRAVEDGGDFILNGQKVFISGASKPDWLYTLVKTKDVYPKHRGLSLIMVPGDAPGVSYRALPTMGGSQQNQIFFDDVRVPKQNLLGEIDRGFYYAMATFEFERSSVP